MHPTRQSLNLLSLTTDPSAKHLMSQERLPFTATYFGSIGLTLYFAVGVSYNIIISPHLASLHYLPHGSLVTAAFIASCDNPAACFVIVVTHSGPKVDLNNPHMIPATHTYYPHVYRIKLTSPPTLTLSFLLLAPKRSTHAHIVDHSARRSGLVPCILLPHGLPRLALRRPIRWQPDNRHVQQLNLACTCAYRQAYVRKSGISGKRVCIRAGNGRTSTVRVFVLSLTLYLLFFALVG